MNQFSTESHGTEMSLFLLIFLGFGLGFSSFGCSNPIGNESSQRKLANDPSICPMAFDELRKQVKENNGALVFLDVPTECDLLLSAVRLVRSDYLRTTGFFTLPPNTSEVCWGLFQKNVNSDLGAFDVRSNCGVQTGWISDSCKNVSSRSEFEAFVPDSVLKQIKGSCNQSLVDDSSCESCVSILSRTEEVYFRGNGTGNVSDCAGYPYMYAAAFGNQFGPTDSMTTKCLFSLDIKSKPKKGKKPNIVLGGVLVGSISGFFAAIAVVWFLWKRHVKRRKRKEHGSKIARRSDSELGLIGGRTSLVRFTIEELRAATRNFSRENLIGQGGYGNVYRGVLADGSEVALKRFKNCSASGDENFKHEVDVIASVRHVNLVALRGYCTATEGTVAMEGHQRIIVCDLMPNGSLCDHLFGSSRASKLSWPIRRKIALGTARGLAYLHNGVKPAIIHRDVKASNILLDETFEPKLADFGLAKFNPDGLSHFSTRVAGTLGYVSPEYALYGQLTEKSDAYSFGVVLLELLSGKKAVISVDGSQTLLLTDWAWSLVREGRARDVIEQGMLELEPLELMEKYVLVAILSAHPVLYARPPMEQIVKILETDLAVAVVPSIPDCPLSLLADRDDIERSVTYAGLGSMFSSVDQRPFEGCYSGWDQRKDVTRTI